MEVFTYQLNNNDLILDWFCNVFSYWESKLTHEKQFIYTKAALFGEVLLMVKKHDEI